MIEPIESPLQFAALRREWNELLQASSSDCFFLTWEWLYTWWKHLSGNRTLFLLKTECGGELAGIAPFAKTKTGVLQFLGTGTAGSDYLDLIIRAGKEQQVLPALAQYFARNNCLVEMAQTRRGSCLAAEFIRHCTESGWRSWEATTNICPTINLKGHSWDSYLATLGSEHRYNVRRKLKNLCNKYTVDFAMAHDESERKEALNTLVSLHSLRWNKRGGSDALFIPEHVSFHDELSALALEGGWLRLFTLRLNAKPVASLYGFRYGTVFYFYQSGFDPSYSNLSVGLLIMGMAIKSAIEEGAEEYDMLHGAERYKFHWAHESREITKLELYPPGVMGTAWKLLRATTRASKKVARNVLPDKVTETIAALWRSTAGKDSYVALSRKDERFPCLTLDRRG